MDVPAVKQRRVSTTMQTARRTHQTVDVARVIPPEMERELQCGNASDSSRWMAGCHARALWKSLEPLPATRRAQMLKARRRTRGASRKVAHTRIPLCTSPFATGRATRESADDSNELKTRPRGECEGVLVAQPDDILSEMRDVSLTPASQGTGRCSGAQRKVQTKPDGAREG